MNDSIETKSGNSSLMLLSVSAYWVVWEPWLLGWRFFTQGRPLNS